MLNKIILGENRLWNCLGTYYQAILECNGYTNEWLNIFKGYSIRYKNIDKNKLLNEYGNNPWGYQPIELYKEEKFCFENLIEQFFEDMDIKVDKIKYSSNINLRATIRNCLENDTYLIINVDEFYLEHLKKYFSKVHNKHFLLVFAMVGDYIRVIDTEIGTSVDIPFEQIEKGVQSLSFRNMMIYYVRLPNNKKTYKQIYDSRQELLQCLVDTEWREDVFNGIYKKVNRKSSNYYLEGFCFMISFKILPYLRWLSYLNEKSEYFDKSNVEKKLNNEILLWKKLIIILELEIRRHSVNIIKRIEVINNKIMINANFLAKGKSV